MLQDVELAVTLLYQLGEGAAEETLKPGSGALGQLATGTLCACVRACMRACDAQLTCA